jgi:hypothetical protein
VKQNVSSDKLIAAGVRRAVLQWKAEASLMRKLRDAGADTATVYHEAQRLAEALRGQLK